MTLDQLRVFVAVAERQHVTRAAEALHMGQSAVSSAIAALELQHATKLFHRVGRGIQLTEAGQAFMAAAREILLQVQNAERLLVELNTGKRGKLRVQASQTIASYWLPRHLVNFHQHDPGVEIHLTVGNTAQAADAVHRGVVELGFVEGQVDDPELISEAVARDQLILVVGPDHPWAGRESLSPAELTDTEWVLRETGSGTRSEFEQALPGFGLAAQNLRVALELPSNEAVRGAVEAGLGATAISASVAAPSLEAGLLRQVKLKLPSRNFYVLRHAERFSSRAAEDFLAIIRER